MIIATIRICLQCQRPRFYPWVRKIPGRREWLPTPVFLPGKFPGQRSQVCYSPWGLKELDMTEQFTHTQNRILESEGIIESVFRVRACMLSLFSCVWLFAALWTIACQVPLSKGFSQQEYWSGLPCSSLRDLPSPGIESVSFMSPVLAGRFSTTSATWEAHLWGK